MESTEVNDLTLYKALCAIRDTCRNHPVTCKGCPLSIEIIKTDENNEGHHNYVCRVYNQQYLKIPRPDNWKLLPPTGYNPFYDD